jgi:hypothetical protein
LIASLALKTAELGSQLIPCRFGEIVSAEAHGSTFSLIMRLEEFCLTQELDAFNHRIYDVLPDLAKWDGHAPPSGELWSFAENPLEGVSESLDLRTWENIVSQLAATASFAEENLFYTVKSIHRLDTRKHVTANAGSFTVRPGHIHEIEIYHKSPLTVPSGSFHVRTTAELQLITNSDLVLDSLYDLKRIRFSAQHYPRKRHAILALYRDFEAAADPASPSRRSWQFDLNFQLSSSLGRIVLLALPVGLLLTVPQAFGLFELTDPAPSSRKAILFVTIAILFNWCAAVIAALGLRRDI